MTETSSHTYDLLVVGAGPSGLACAIEAGKARLSCVILEKGNVVDYLRRFPTNVVWFSTPELLEIGGIPFITSTFRPTRVDTLNYYQRVASHFGLTVKPFNAVQDIRRDGDRFTVGTESGARYRSRNVVLATGYFDHPNRLGIPGEDLGTVEHYYTEPFRYVGTDVTVVGGRNSAVEAALDLFRHGARVTLVHRGKDLSQGVKYWILPDITNRIAAGEIEAHFESTVKEIRTGGIVLETPSGTITKKNDVTFVLIGFRPDVEALHRYGVETDQVSLAPRFDERTFETNVPGLYVAGSVVAGRYNNKVFVENGRLHGAVIVSAILSRTPPG